MSFNSTTTANTRNATRDDTYPDIAKRLNCSKLVLSHRGVKLEEVRSDTIFKEIKIQRVPASRRKPDKSKEIATSTTTEEPSSSDEKYTLPPGIFDDSFSGGVPVSSGQSDIFGSSEEEPDPLAALLAGDAQEDQDPIAALLGQQTTPASKQQPRKLESEPVQNQVKLTTANRQENSAKNETSTKPDDILTMENSTKIHKYGDTYSTVKHECDYAFDSDGTVVYWYEVSGLSVCLNITSVNGRLARVFPVGTWRSTGNIALSSPSPVSLSAPFGPTRFLSAPLDLIRPGSDSNRKRRPSVGGPYPGASKKLAQVVHCRAVRWAWFPEAGLF